MGMSNGDKPAAPCIRVPTNAELQLTPNLVGVDENGLTKREAFCLHNGVPDTGDAELDAIIVAGEHRKDARAAMQGMMANEAKGTFDGFASAAVNMADALLAALEESK